AGRFTPADTRHLHVGIHGKCAAPGCRDIAQAQGVVAAKAVSYGRPGNANQRRARRKRDGRNCERRLIDGGKKGRRGWSPEIPSVPRSQTRSPPNRYRTRTITSTVPRIPRPPPAP